MTPRAEKARFQDLRTYQTTRLAGKSASSINLNKIMREISLAVWLRLGTDCGAPSRLQFIHISDGTRPFYSVSFSGAVLTAVAFGFGLLQTPYLDWHRQWSLHQRFDNTITTTQRMAAVLAEMNDFHRRHATLEPADKCKPIRTSLKSGETVTIRYSPLFSWIVIPGTIGPDF